MNLDLESLLSEEGVTWVRLRKPGKVRLLARWSLAFPVLFPSRRDVSRRVLRGQNASNAISALSPGTFFIVPDDASAMPTYGCDAKRVPDLSPLVSDTFTKCEEIVVVDADLAWSVLYENGGSPRTVGVYFTRADG